MVDWKKFYDTYPLSFGPTEYLKQVGHTLHGRPVTGNQFELILESMRTLLDLQKSDVLLDLCCGNGVFTKRLAAMCDRVVGVDFSRPLLEVARRDHRPENVTYHLMNALTVDSKSEVGSMRFSKVVMCGALQHLKPEQLEPLLRNLIDVTSDGRIIVFSLVPDRSKKWAFYGTAGTRIRHFARLLAGRERMGTWWSAEEIRATCRRLDLASSISRIDDRLHYSQYRFDVRLTSG